MEPRRVVITGVGVVSALGPNKQSFWTETREGRSGIGPMQAADSSKLKFNNIGEVRTPIEEMLSAKEDLGLDRCGQFALIPAREAVTDAGLEFSDELKLRTGVVTGCAVGGKLTEEREYHNIFVLNKKRGHPLSIPRVMGNAGASRVSLEYQLRGPTFTLSTACASANHAIGQAFWLIRNGAADVALTGGHEAFIVDGHLRSWDALRVVSPTTCQPFCADRQGMILGEGGAMLAIETLEHAKQRGAEIYAEIVGFGMTSDAHHITMPSMEGPARAMQAALADAGLSPETVSYVNAHGTGTEANDPNETRAIRMALGAHADKIAVSSTKALHGHALGATGALEAAAVACAIKDGILPPTVNFTTADPECDLDYVPNEAREAEIDVALSNSFAFGGLNAVLAFRRFR